MDSKSADEKSKLLDWMDGPKHTGAPKGVESRDEGEAEALAPPPLRAPGPVEIEVMGNIEADSCSCRGEYAGPVICLGATSSIIVTIVVSMVCP